MAVVRMPPWPRLVTRRGWRADESLRLDAHGVERWPPTCERLRGVVVHHTCSPNGERDPMARVRAIYGFHAVERGWGDMGYHLLIDEGGTLYEGRSGTAQVLDGGAVVMGGHVYGHNAGTLGIALLGSLGDRPPSVRAFASLVAVTSRLVQRHGLDPLGARSAATGGVMPTICAHRDLARATCPGDAFYGMLPELRARVAAAVDACPTSLAAARR